MADEREVVNLSPGRRLSAHDHIAEDDVLSIGRYDPTPDPWEWPRIQRSLIPLRLAAIEDPAGGYRTVLRGVCDCGQVFQSEYVPDHSKSEFGFCDSLLKRFFRWLGGESPK